MQRLGVYLMVWGGTGVDSGQAAGLPNLRQVAE